jgi:tetratricopeptide (TPR) repeat protein
MGEVVKFPGKAVQRGYKRARRRPCAEDPNQLALFAEPAAEVTEFTSGLSAFERALYLDEQGDDRAVDLYLEAIAAGECVADAYCNLGAIESRRGNTTLALDCFTKALQENPRHGIAHYNLANLYLEVNDTRLAQIHYEMTTRVEPEMANAFYNLALARSLHRDHRGALDAILSYQDLVGPAEREEAEGWAQALRRSLASHSKS